jgi:hypothetical protein
MVTAPPGVLRPLLRLASDRRGSAYMLEFAVVVNILLMMLMLGFEAAFQMAIGTALDHGAREASRMSALGPDGGLGSHDAMLARVMSRTGLPLASWAAGDPDLRMEVFASYPALAAASALPDDKTCPGSNAWAASPGGSSRIVRYCIAFQARAFTPFARALLPSGVFRHRTFFVVQNEPY